MAEQSSFVVLSDGTWFQGEAFGASTAASGPVIFNTAMTGGQELITDPALRGQMVVMTTPHVGNTGVNELDSESDKAHIAGLVVRELSRVVSNFRATGSLNDFLAQHGVSGISGVDTRILTQKIRDSKGLRAAIVHGISEAEIPGVVEQLQGEVAANTAEQVRAVSTAAPVRVVARDSGDNFQPLKMERVADQGEWPAELADRPLVVVLDLGVRTSLLRHLHTRGYRTVLLPAFTPAADILSRQPAGVVVSGGPGDALELPSIVKELGVLVGQLPVLAVGLGHLLVGQAVGGTVEGLAPGHHGINHPVRRLASGRVMMTTQGHGQSLVLEATEGGATPSHESLNDGSLEGFEWEEKLLMSVQFYPEASPGNHESWRVLDRFEQLVASSGRR